ncbi:helix-turn-helix domain-containing protein [Halobacteriovorax sp. RT-1-4]|uniref:AraC family transcriptional regulator n=1 Tax=unclassified Halobacteriovorax TaxID=2639665 RepID=UPI003999D626
MNRKIYLFDYFTVIESESLNVEFHSHIAQQLSFSLDSCPLKYETEEGVFEKRFIYLPSLTKHRFLSESCHNLTILIDEDASFKLDVEHIDTRVLKLETINRKSVESFLKQLGLISNKELDERIIKLFQMIKDYENLDEVKLKDFANSLALSESRLLHLFKEEVGVTFRKYILWQKLKRAVDAQAEGRNITDIAIAAGFSDSAHFSKFFKQSFGLSPKEIFKNSQFIQE